MSRARVMPGDSFRVFMTVDPPTEEQVTRARSVCAAYSTDEADLCALLATLGICEHGT